MCSERFRVPTGFDGKGFRVGQDRREPGSESGGKCFKDVEKWLICFSEDGDAVDESVKTDIERPCEAEGRRTNFGEEKCSVRIVAWVDRDCGANEFALWNK
jgi:hypothetical protein